MVDRFFAEDAAEDLLASVASAKCPNFSNSVLVLLSGLETTENFFFEFFLAIIFSISSPVVTGTVDLVIIILNLFIANLFL